MNKKLVDGAVGLLGHTRSMNKVISVIVLLGLLVTETTKALTVNLDRDPRMQRRPNPDSYYSPLHTLGKREPTTHPTCSPSIGLAR